MFSLAQAHQVFYNYRGEQLRYSFVSHLSDAFKRHGIKFFQDKDEQRGKDLVNLFVRIEESRIALAIFSTRLYYIFTLLAIQHLIYMGIVVLTINNESSYSKIIVL